MAALLLEIVFLAGCSATYQAALDRSTARGDTLSLTHLNSRLSDRHVVVRRVNGQEIEGTYMRSTPDSCYMLNDDSCAVPTVVLTNEIKTIEYRNHLTGFLGGFISGIFLGLLFAGAAFSISWSGGSNAWAFLALLASLASFIGLPIYGGVDGVPSTIQFPGDSTTATIQREAAPDNTRAGQTQRDTTIRALADSLSGNPSGGGGQSPQ